MDLTLEVKDYKLNIRASVIINHNGKILVHKNKNSDYYALMGGRMKIGEDSINTVKREFLEEVGKEIEVTGNIGTIENFFEENGNKYHEIQFVHMAEFVNEEDKKIDYSLKNIEGEDWLQYEWVELEKLDEYCIKPYVIKEMLNEKNFPAHKINRDE